LLELPLVQFRQRLRAAEIRGLSFFLKLRVIAESVFEPAFDEVDGEVGDINANPFAARTRSSLDQPGKSRVLL
jgi:hypothetical protein